MRLTSHLPLILVNLAGVMAFAFPFFLAARPSESEALARSGDAPWLLALLVPLLIGVAVAEASAGRLDAKSVALLGVLGGIAALLRIPISFAGANLMFVIPIAAGFVFGPSFGFLLGSLAMAASAAITGGIGPWLPFQMWAAGWVGAGAGLLKPAGDRLATSRWAVVILAAYGYLSGLLFGAVMNLYFWPLLSPAQSDIGWSAGIGVAEAMRRYRNFYLLTSLPWDAVRGILNAGVILAAGRAIIDVLRRYKKRFSFEFVAR